ncbi:unnamed protein product [Choristocarpus tenellus]
MAWASIDRDWEPLGTPDYIVLFFVGLWQLSTLLVCVHLAWCRNWPPYVTMNINLVVLTVSGME